MGIFRRRRLRGAAGPAPWSVRRARQDPLDPRTDAPDTETRPARHGADPTATDVGPDPTRTSHRSTQVPPDPGLPMFDGPHAARFSALARQVFAEHGLECTYHDGYLKGTDGRSYGLTNIALLAAQGPSQVWRTLLDQHVDGIVAAHDIPHERDLEAVRDRLYLRLWATSDLPARPDSMEPLSHRLAPRADEEAFDPLGGSGSGDALVGLASIDHPEHVETLTGARDVALLGGWEAVREVALANLEALRADEVVPIGDDLASQVQLSVGGFFNASRVFTMGRLLREDFLLEAPAHGVLFVVPNRHLVAVHPLTGPGMVEATGTLIRLARGEHEVPGSISPHVWFWREDRVAQVTRPAEDDDHAVELHVDGLLEQAMRELGLIEDP